MGLRGLRRLVVLGALALFTQYKSAEAATYQDIVWMQTQMQQQMAMVQYMTASMMEVSKLSMAIMTNIREGNAMPIYQPTHYLPGVLGAFQISGYSGPVSMLNTSDRGLLLTPLRTSVVHYRLHAPREGLYRIRVDYASPKKVKTVFHLVGSSRQTVVYLPNTGGNFQVFGNSTQIVIPLKAGMNDVEVKFQDGYPTSKDQPSVALYRIAFE